MRNAIPPSLARHGIRAVADNLHTGTQVQVSGRELARLFGIEVVQKLGQKHDGSTQHEESQHE